MESTDRLEAPLAFHGHRRWASTAGVRAGLAAPEALDVEVGGGKSLHAIVDIGRAHPHRHGHRPQGPCRLQADFATEDPHLGVRAESRSGRPADRHPRDGAVGTRPPHLERPAIRCAHRRARRARQLAARRGSGPLRRVPQVRGNRSPNRTCASRLAKRGASTAPATRPPLGRQPQPRAARGQRRRCRGSLAGVRIMTSRVSSRELKYLIGGLLWVVAAKITGDLVAV
jgi:hypothetical protein